MIFLDTSAIYALADAGDANHAQARELFRRAIDAGEDLLTHSYVLVESAALLQHRLGLSSALQFLRESDGFLVHWLGSREHQQARDLLEQRGRRGLSLVDCASFVVMRRYAVMEAFAFDPDFAREGFVAYSGTP